jgi:hypothetical protein
MAQKKERREYTQKESLLSCYINVRRLAVFGGLELVMAFRVHSLRTNALLQVWFDFRIIPHMSLKKLQSQICHCQ